MMRLCLHCSQSDFSKFARILSIWSWLKWVVTSLDCTLSVSSRNCLPRSATIWCSFLLSSFSLDVVSTFLRLSVSL